MTYPEMGVDPTPPGWHPDPWRQAQYRWWDGAEWTFQTWGAAPPQPSRTGCLVVFVGVIVIVVIIWAVVAYARVKGVQCSSGQC